MITGRCSGLAEVPGGPQDDGLELPHDGRLLEVLARDQADRGEPRPLRGESLAMSPCASPCRATEVGSSPISWLPAMT